MVEVNRTTSGVTRIVRCAAERDPSTPNIGLASAHRGARALGFPPLDIVPLRSVVPGLALGAYKFCRQHRQFHGISPARGGQPSDKLMGDLASVGPLRALTRYRWYQFASIHDDAVLRGYKFFVREDSAGAELL